MCGGKTLRGSIEPTAGGGSAYGLRPTASTLPGSPCIRLHWGWRTASQKPDGYSQACYATGENHESEVLRQLLGELNLEGVLIQADALHTQKPFFDSCRSRGPTSS